MDYVIVNIFTIQGIDIYLIDYLHKALQCGVVIIIIIIHDAFVEFVYSLPT